jgi:hypothetical protein
MIHEKGYQFPDKGLAEYFSEKTRLGPPFRGPLGHIPVVLPGRGRCGKHQGHNGNVIGGGSIHTVPLSLPCHDLMGSKMVGPDACFIFLKDGITARNKSHQGFIKNPLSMKGIFKTVLIVREDLFRDSHFKPLFGKQGSVQALRLFVQQGLGRKTESPHFSYGVPYSPQIGKKGKAAICCSFYRHYSCVLIFLILVLIYNAAILQER